MGKGLLCGGLLFLAPLLAGADAGSRGSSLSTVRTRYFEIVSADAAGGNFTARLCERLSETVRPWLRLPLDFSNRILVRLQPASEYPYEEPFRIGIEMAGNVGATVRWDRATELESLERAVTRALLARLGVWNGIAGDRISVPFWVEAAIQRSVRSVGNPSYVDGMAREMKERGPLPLREILYRGREEPWDDRFADNAYWLLQHLLHHSRRSDRMHNLIVRLLGGGDPENSLMATFGPEIEEFDRAPLWWAVGVYDRIQRRALTQSRFRDSLQLLHSLYRFSYRREGREVRLDVDELWAYRKELPVRSEVIQRMERINYEMRAVHPFHYNAVLSLGRVMVALLEDDEEEFRRQADLFRDDYRDAERLHEETVEALDRVEEDLGFE